MKLTFEKSDLVRCVGIVQKAVSVRTTMKILECILIDASAGNINFTANDLDLGIQTLVPGEIIEKGRVAIDAKLFSGLVRKLPEEKISFETSDDNSNMCIIKCDKKTYKIPGMPAEEFTYFPEIEKTNSIKLSQMSLKEIINQTIFSLAINDINPIMTGELFETNENSLRVIALDSHRIALRKIEIDISENKVYTIIPGKSLKEIAGILALDADKEVNIYFTDKHVLFEFDETKVVSRVIEGTYLNVNKMFSTDSETKVVIDRKALIDAIDTEMVFIKESDKRPIIFDFKDDYVRLFVKSTLGQGEEEVEIEKEGADLKIGFNPKFLLDVLKVIEDEKVTLSFVNAKSPCFIRDEKDTYLYLVLPVNFTEE